MTTHTHTMSAEGETLAALIPTIDPAQYARRDLGGISDVEMLRLAMGQRWNVLLEGPTGTGKSLVGEVLAAEEGLPFFSIPVNAAIDPGMVFGGLRPQTDKTLQWVDTNVTAIIRNGGVIVWDEIDMAHPRVMAAFHELLADSRRVSLLDNNGEVVNAAANVLFIGTMNGRKYDGTTQLNGALRRRFKWQFHFGYSRDVESQLIRSETLLDLADEIRDRDRMPDIRTDLSTPILQMVEQTAELVSMDFAIDRLIETFAEGERPGVRRAAEMLAPTISNELGLGE